MIKFTSGNNYVLFFAEGRHNPRKNKTFAEPADLNGNYLEFLRGYDFGGYRIPKKGGEPIGRSPPPRIQPRRSEKKASEPFNEPDPLVRKSIKLI